MTAPSDRDEQAPRKPLKAPQSASDPVSGVAQRPGVVSEPHRGSQRLHGRSALTVTIDAPDARHAVRWAGYLRNHVEAEYGDQMRLQTAIELDDPDCGCHTAGDGQPGERCCVCGGVPVVYRNYREQPFCQHCADCQCTENPCVLTGTRDPAVSQESQASDWERTLRAKLRDAQAETRDLRAAIDRVEAVVDDMRHTTGARFWAELIETAAIATPPTDEPQTCDSGVTCAPAGRCAAHAEEDDR